MGNSPSKNASPNTHTLNSSLSNPSGSSSTSSTGVPNSEPEPDDRKYPSSIHHNQSNSRSTTSHHLKSGHHIVNHDNNNIKINNSSSNHHHHQNGGKLHYNKQKIQMRIPETKDRHFTYYDEDSGQNNTQSNSSNDTINEQVSPDPFELEINLSMAKALNISNKSNENVEVSSSLSDLFTIGSSSDSSSLSLTPPNANTLSPIQEKSTLAINKSGKSKTFHKIGVDIDSIIERLLTSNSSHGHNSSFGKHSPTSSSPEFFITPKEISIICAKAREVFLDQPSLLRLSAPVKVVGDIHGQFNDLLRILKLSGLPPHSNYLFLGDYVDRGKQSLETILLLFCYKIKYPENFFMLRGNHESANVSKIYGFYDECKRRLNLKCWKLFVDVFNTLPIAAIINDKIFCVHGGLSPNLNTLSQIEKIHRPTDIPDSGLLADLLWSDPDSNANEWSESDRGVSYCFGKKVVDNFTKKFHFDLIIRGHMVVEDGYEFFAKKKLVTVFSAPNYCGEFNNWGAVMSVDKGLLCSFELLKPNKKLIH